MPFTDAITCLGTDVSDRPETARITRVEFRPDNFLVRHSKETGPNAWPGVHIPGWGDGGADKGEIQWTLWLVIRVGGRFVTGGCIEFWPDPTLGVNRGGPAPFSDAARNWYYQIPGMAGTQPGVGDRIGIFATAGDQRVKDLFLVAERSNVVWMNVPANDTGVFDFPDAPPVPQPVPAPPTPIPPTPIPTPIPPAPVPSSPSSPTQLAQILLQILTSLRTINTRLNESATHTDITQLQSELESQGTAIVTALSHSGTSPDTVSSLLKLFGRK